MSSTLADTWRINNNVTMYLVDHLPDEVWSARVPGYKQKTVRMIGAHLHNCRGMWVKMLGKRFDIWPALQVDRHRVARVELIVALGESGDTIARLVDASVAGEGKMTGFSPPDVHYFVSYMTAHEGHHRGQMAMAARQLGSPLSTDVMAGMWQWSKRLRELR